MILLFLLVSLFHKHPFNVDLPSD